MAEEERRNRYHDVRDPESGHLICRYNPEQHAIQAKNREKRLVTVKLPPRTGRPVDESGGV